jgi:hypothetical protein
MLWMALDQIAVSGVSAKSSLLGKMHPRHSEIDALDRLDGALLYHRIARGYADAGPGNREEFFDET